MKDSRANYSTRPCSARSPSLKSSPPLPKEILECSCRVPAPLFQQRFHCYPVQTRAPADGNAPTARTILGYINEVETVNYDDRQGPTHASAAEPGLYHLGQLRGQIGRASCRVRGELS